MLYAVTVSLALLCELSSADAWRASEAVLGSIRGMEPHGIRSIPSVAPILTTGPV